MRLLQQYPRNIRWPSLPICALLHYEAIEIHTALGLVAAGLGYALMGALIAAHGHNAVVFVKLP